MPSQTSMPFGAVLERVPTAGAQWSTSERVVVPRKSPWSSLVSLLLLAALAGGGWYGYQHWYVAGASLPPVVADYVGGTGVAYTSPVTGVGGEFAGPPVETVLPGGAPASVYATADWAIVVAVYPAPAVPGDVDAAFDAYATGRPVRLGTTTAAGSTFAAAVVGGDSRTAEALFERLTSSLRLPGGATIPAN